MDLFCDLLLFHRFASSLSNPLSVFLGRLPVTNIGDEAFNECALTSLTIRSSVTSPQPHSAWAGQLLKIEITDPSTTAPWEDRSELMAALMNDGDRMALRSYYRRDPVLQRKIELMSGLLSKLCGPNQANYFWEQAIISLKTQPEVATQSNSRSAPKADLQKVSGP